MYSTPVECPQVHPSIVLYVQQDPLLLCLRVTDYNITLILQHTDARV